MIIGAHVSIAGGIFKAPENAHEFGCEGFQIFTRSPQGGAAPILTDEILEKFFKNCKKFNQNEWVVHAPYYINFANPEKRIRENSVRIITEELNRSNVIKATHLMFHTGSARGSTREEGLKFAVDGIKRVLHDYEGNTHLLIEISAGAGEVIGDTFEEIAHIIDEVGHPKLGVCFDTQHAFASGYDLRNEEAVKNTFLQFDKIIGLSKLKMSHCNDSKIELGGHKDRHEHLGKGCIGEEGFAALLKNKDLAHVSWYCETEYDLIKEDVALLKDIRKKQA